MNKKIIIGLLIMSIFLVGCSAIPKEERNEYCVNKGGYVSTTYSGGFKCAIPISDIDYSIEKYEKETVEKNKKLKYSEEKTKQLED